AYGFILGRSGNLVEAKAEFEQAAKLKPGFPEAHHHLGVTHWMLKDYPKSIIELQSALRLDPSNVDSHYYLGLAYFQQRQFHSAIQELETARNLNPASAHIRSRLG